MSNTKNLAKIITVFAIITLVLVLIGSLKDYIVYDYDWYSDDFEYVFQMPDGMTFILSFMFTASAVLFFVYSLVSKSRPAGKPLLIIALALLSAWFFFSFIYSSTNYFDRIGDYIQSYLETIKWSIECKWDGWFFRVFAYIAELLYPVFSALMTAALIMTAIKKCNKTLPMIFAFICALDGLFVFLLYAYFLSKEFNALRLLYTMYFLGNMLLFVGIALAIKRLDCCCNAEPNTIAIEGCGACSPVSSEQDVTPSVVPNQPTKLFCSNCGAKVNGNFCPYCGTKVK